MFISEVYMSTIPRVCFVVPDYCIGVYESICLSQFALLCYRFISVIVITAVGANRVGSADKTVGGRLA